MALSIVTEPADITFSKNDIDFVLQATGYSALDNYKVHFIVEFQSLYNSGPFIEVLSGSATPSEDGKIFFKLESLLHNYLLNAIKEEPPLPPVVNPSVTVAKISRQYRVKYFESYGIPVVDQPEATTADKKVLLGGVPAVEWTPDYLTNIANNKTLLTNYPDYKMVGYDQPEYLSWFNNGGAGGVNIKSFDEYGITIDDINISTASSLHEVVIIPIGPSENGLSENATSFRVAVSNVNIRYYHIDPRNHEWKFDLIYFNSFNVPEILRVTGTKDKKVDVDRSKTQGEDGIIEQYDYDFDQVLTYTTGYLGNSEVDALQELVVYNQLYEIDLDKEVYLPLDLLDSSYSLSKTRQFLNALTFQARISSKKKVVQLE